MLRFRTRPSQPSSHEGEAPAEPETHACRSPGAPPSRSGAGDLLLVSQVIDDAIQPGNFFAVPELALSWIAARSETIPWEIFRGRLLDPAHTRATRSFLSWHVIQDGQPMLSVKLDVYVRRIHVTRGILCHVWEGYDSGGGVIDSREAVKWTHELVGTIALDEYADLDDVHDELICLLWQAVVGTSRLPLTSLEAPLPAFVYGELHYLYAAGAGEMRTTLWPRWFVHGMHTDCARRETVKLVEFTLRHIKPADVPAIAHALSDYVPMLPSLLRSMFNEVSLSPYTGFVDNALALIEQTGQHEVLGHLLRQLGRHLTAYDLVTFHHRGANYPDALLLDAVLKAYLRYLEANPALFTTDESSARWRRQSLRQGILMRRHYEGHRVPDAPTSPGENARVMPAIHPRVPDEQIAQPNRRKRQLFADEPLEALLSEQAKRVFAQSIGDLDVAELHIELDLGIFIDRPLGYGKAVGEPDQTPLLAHEAFSPSVARQRLQELGRLCEELGLPFDGALMERQFSVSGLSHHELADCPRPVAALADVRKVATDFVILRTLPGGLAELLKRFDWRPLLARFRLRFLAAGEVRWCVQALGGTLILGDMEGRRRLEMLVDDSKGYMSRAGVELPHAGLLVVALWEDGGLTRHELTAPWSVACTR